MLEDKSAFVLLTEEEIRRLLKLVDAAIFLGKDPSPLDLPLEGKLEGALMAAGPSPE